MDNVLDGRANFYLALAKVAEHRRIQQYPQLSLQAFAVDLESTAQVSIEILPIEEYKYSYRTDVHDKNQYIGTHVVIIDPRTFTAPSKIKFTQVRILRGIRCIDRWACASH